MAFLAASRTQVRARLFWRQSRRDLRTARQARHRLRNMYVAAGSAALNPEHATAYATLSFLALQSALNALAAVVILHHPPPVPMGSLTQLLHLAALVDEALQVLWESCAELEQAQGFNPFSAAEMPQKAPTQQENEESAGPVTGDASPPPTELWLRHATHIQRAVRGHFLRTQGWRFTFC